ncbi:MAG: biotin/lipoate A/B protein ligase family protein [Planctomycetota bacterium]
MSAAWRRIETWDASPVFAMGLDEALLRSVGAPPTLRLYSWAPDAVSLGYFQAFEDVPCAAAHPHVVRRLTGGGAIHHHPRELTFSIAVDEDEPAYRGPVPRSYERVHAAIARALEDLGLPAAGDRGAREVASDVEGTGMCFHESTPLDPCWARADGALAKGVGTAQRRSQGRVLHHGSIKLGPSPLEPEIATLSEVGIDVTVNAAGEALVRAVESVLGVRVEPGEATSAEGDTAATLGARYGDPSFVHREVRRRRKS